MSGFFPVVLLYVRIPLPLRLPVKIFQRQRSVDLLQRVPVRILPACFAWRLVVVVYHKSRLCFDNVLVAVVGFQVSKNGL